MVSLPSGAASAKKSIQRSLQWLQGYAEIVLFFDNDEAGRKASEEAASVLQPGKCEIYRDGDVLRFHYFNDATTRLTLIVEEFKEFLDAENQLHVVRLCRGGMRYGLYHRRGTRCSKAVLILTW
jgi:hypothetical protein